MRFTVPADAYELNFIFGDGEGGFDNNATANYLKPVEGAMTPEAWQDAAAERAVRAGGAVVGVVVVVVVVWCGQREGRGRAPLVSSSMEWVLAHHGCVP